MKKVMYAERRTIHMKYHKPLLRRLSDAYALHRPSAKWLGRSEYDVHRVPRWVIADITQASMTFAVKRKMPLRRNQDRAEAHEFEYVVCNDSYREPEWNWIEGDAWEQKGKICWKISHQYNMKERLEYIADVYKANVVIMQGESYWADESFHFIPTRMIVDKKIMKIRDAKTWSCG